VPLPFLSVETFWRIWLLIVTVMLRDQCLRASQHAYGGWRTAAHVAEWGLVVCSAYEALLLLLPGDLAARGVHLPDLVVPGLGPVTSLRLCLVAGACGIAVMCAARLRTARGESPVQDLGTAGLALAMAAYGAIHEVAGSVPLPASVLRWTGVALSGLGVVAGAAATWGHWRTRRSRGLDTDGSGQAPGDKA